LFSFLRGDNLSKVSFSNFLSRDLAFITTLKELSDMAVPAIMGEMTPLGEQRPATCYRAQKRLRLMFAVMTRRRKALSGRGNAVCVMRRGAFKLIRLLA
jgi:hypothetical protein